MKKLTPQEEEAMQAIWKMGGGMIKDFLDELPEPRPPYTTLASTVRNLEKKGYVRSEKLGNTYRFMPSIKMEEYKKRFMSEVVNDYFKNSYKELVSFFIKQRKLNTEELKEIIDIIEKSKTK